MADKKKVYSIQINGLKESLDLVKSLTDQLKSLDSAIDAIGERKVKVTGTVEVEDTAKTKVSGGGGDADRQKQLAIEKQITAEKRAQGQLDAMQTEEYRKSYEAMAQTKDQIKDAKRELDALASGAAELTDEGLQYANTMKGMKAELKALKAERDGLDLAKPEEVERFKEIQQRALELETLLKSLESEAGVFSRNVGNYPQLFRQSTEELANVEKIIVSLSDKLAKATPGTEGYDKLKSELESAEKYADRLRERLKDVEDEIGTINAAGFKIDVGGKEREFNSMKEAVRTLTQELQQMTLAGEENTQEFEDTIKALGRVKTAISQTSGEIQSYIGNTKGLNDTLEIMRGMAGVASLGAGISQLFGGENQELDKTLKTFTAITLIMNGLQAIQNDINDKTSIWGGTLAKVDGLANKITIGMTGIEKKNLSAGANELLSALDDIQAKFQAMSGNGSPDFINAGAASVEQYADSLKRVTELRIQLNEAEKEGNTAAVDQITASLRTEEQVMNDVVDQMRDMAENGTGMSKTLATAFMRVQKSVAGIQASMVKAGVSFRTANAAAGALNAGMKALAVGIGAVRVAFNALLKATVILAVIQLAVEAVVWVVEKLVDAFNALKGPSALGVEERMGAIEARTNQARKAMEDYLNTLETAKGLGFITETEKQVLALQKLQDETVKTAKEIRDYMKVIDELKAEPLEMHLNNSSIWGDEEDIKDIDDFKAHYDVLIKAVELGIDKIEAGWTRGSGALLTAGDAVEQLGDDTKAVLGAMMNDINRIDFSNPEQAVKEFRKITDNELYQSALTQMHTLFPEEEWAQALDRLYKKFSDTMDDMEQRQADFAVAIHQANEQMARDTEQSRINAISDENERNRQQLEFDKRQKQKEISESVADETHKQERLAALDEEYKQKEKDRQKKANKSAQQTASQAGAKQEQAMKAIRDNLLAIMQEGLDKQIKTLENRMADEIAAARKNGVKVGEVVASIQKKYQYLIAKAREDWQRQQQQRQKQWNKAWEDMMRQHYENLRQMQDEAQSGSIQRDIQENENVHTENTQTISYNVEVNRSGSLPDSDRMLQEQKRYYQQMLEEQVDYLEERDRLNREAADVEYQNAVDAENRSYEQRLATNKEWYEAQLEQQNEAARNGQVTEEEYQANLLQITNAYQNANADDYEAHNLKLEELDAEHQQTLRNIEVQGNADRQAAESEAISNRISAVQEMYDEIGEYAERKQKENVNRHTGLFSIGTERKRLEEVKAAYETTMQELELAYEDLKAKLNDGEIDFNQFKEAKKQIDDLAKNAKKGADETAENLDDLVQTWGQSMNDFAQKVGQQMQELYSQFDAIWDLKLQAQEDALDREQEYLDREKDMVEKAYDKQKEIVDRYKDAINDSEDELKSARGERRLALLDGLAQQREAYLNETETLKKQEVEKEKIAKKEEQLKKKQEQLEKQRKKKEQMASIVQATINTALGVTQALGAWPPPASYALAAAVGALGAVQIALIASQKFAKGGVIEGPSHSRGGVTVGFSASGVRQEAEGGEMIVNRRSTRENESLLYFINQSKRHLTKEDLERFYDGKETVRVPARSARFADGGQMPELNDYSDYSPNQPVQVELSLDSKVSVVDIMNATDRLTQTRVLAGLD